MIDLDNVDEVLSLEIDKYERCLNTIRQCAAFYEKVCEDLIRSISLCQNADDAGIYFDRLETIQIKFAKLFFNNELRFSSKMNALINNFDRLHDEFDRKYWFKKFQSGCCWPYDKS